MRPLPPSVEEGYLRPYEGHIRVLVQLLDHIIDNVLRLPLEVLFEGLEPAGVIVRVRNDDYLKP